MYKYCPHVISCPHAWINIRTGLGLPDLLAQMNFETIFLVSALIFVGLVLLYEIIFILFFKNANKATSRVKEFNQASLTGDMEEILVQRKPLGYGEVSSRSFEQCATPVFELTETPVAISSSSISEPLETKVQDQVQELELEHVQVKGKRIPVLVITPNDS